MKEMQSVIDVHLERYNEVHSILNDKIREDVLLEHLSHYPRVISRASYGPRPLGGIAHDN